MKKPILWVIVVACLFLGGMFPQAQTGTKGSSDWKYELDAFLWGTGMTATIGPSQFKTLKVNASFGSILDYLDMAFMGSFGARKDRWGFQVDAFYVDLGHTTENSFGYPVKLSVKDLILGASGTYRVVDTPKATLDWIFGARYNEAKTELTPKWFPTRSRSLAWTDPVFGLKGTAKISPRWTFGYRLDVGGLDAGSEYTWLTVARFDCQVSKHTAVNFGYMGYGVKYTSGSGLREFVYQTTMQGPMAGMAFRW